MASLARIPLRLRPTRGTACLLSRCLGRGGQRGPEVIVQEMGEMVLEFKHGNLGQVVVTYRSIATFLRQAPFVRNPDCV